ncbi:MAG TPA: signal peptide peptidase SppA, partial [Myxococcaceae bacterium]|nr:signal peptide peptidase SppA [Myxococcaceae bacterium]
FLDERYRSLVQSLVQGRHLSEAEAVRAIDDAPLSARRALERRLCDGLVSESDLPRKLGSTPDASEDDSKTDARVVTYAEYLQSLRFPPRRWARFRRLPRLGVVPLSGMIVDGEGGGSPLGPKMTGAEGVKKAIARAARDRRTRALLLYVTSPGGSALGSELLLEEVKRAAKKKPVVAFFDQVAASGGYMAVLGAKEIWATPHAVAGSIGVFAGKFDLSGLLGKFGIHRTVITRGRNAGIYSSAKPFDESERRALEESVEDTYQAFLAHVAAARGMSVEEVHARGEGRVFSGTRALEQRLVDRLGGFEEAGARALELAGASARQFDVITYSPAMPRFAFLRALQSGASAGIYSLDLVTARADLSGHSDGL